MALSVTQKTTRALGIISIGLFVFLLLSFQPTFAYVEIGESNDILNEGHYRFGSLLQMRLSDGGGTNLTAFADGRINEEMGWRGFLGGGDLDFYAGGSLKWVPIPDYQNQPSLGGKVEANFGRKKDNSLFSVRVVPMASKKTDWVGHQWSPFVGLPIGVSSSAGKSDFFANLAAGSEVKFEGLDDVQFVGELGIGLTNSFSYLSIGVTYLLDANQRRR